MKFKRTHKCTSLSPENAGENVVIMGWVQKRRDHGGLIFLDIRDRSGLVQIVFSPKNEKAFNIAEKIKVEYVVAIKAKVRKRPEGNINPDMKTGEIELLVKDVEILAKSKTPPFQIENSAEVNENIRLQYRYLDLRRPFMKNIMKLRHNAMKKTRDYLIENDFWEIETPILTKSTPEGARDYLVPSRVKPGNFYALPQSPQLFKQLLMVSGIERYFQIARCFRDEDLRANRQPEFTQIDIEMAFVKRNDVLSIVEGLTKQVFALANIEVPDNIPVMSYERAISEYGTDKPDLRFDMKLFDISKIVEDSDFNIFSKTIKNGGQVKGIKVEKGADFTRSYIDELTEHVKIFGAKGLAWFAVKNDNFKSPIAKFLSKQELNEIKEKMNAKNGDLLLFVADKPKIVASSLGNLRLKLADEMNLIPDNSHKFIWIVDFPLLEYDEDEDRYIAQHHPFTAPLEKDIELLDKNPEKVRANAYDLVMDGEELCGGSIRINTEEIQRKVFSALNITKKEAKEKFGFLLEAFSYGAPPHGGVAFGFDRMIQLMSGADSIRDVIAFPKTQSATSPLTNAPTPVSKEQLDELGIKLKNYK
ncbi:MAG: aspartate--tRNA ligase [Halanaerobiales bacterium]